MKRILLTAAAVTVFSMCSMAQYTSTTSSGSQDSTKMEKKSKKKMKHDMNKSDNMSSSMQEKTLIGCIESNGDEFMLKKSRGRSVEITSSEDLKPHVGHKVKLMGMYDMSGEMKEKSEMAESKAKGEMKKHERHFKVTKMEMISDTCKGGGAKKTKKEKESTM